MKKPAVMLMLACAALFAQKAKPAKQAKPALKTVKFAALSIQQDIWDKDANIRRIENMVRRAASEGAQIITVPAGAVEGGVVTLLMSESDPARKKEQIPDFLALAEPATGPTVRGFQKLCKELKVFLVFGMLESKGRRRYNTAFVIGPRGRLLGQYRQTHFPRAWAGQIPGLVPGNQYPVFKMGSVKLGVIIGYDSHVPEAARELALGGADIIACLDFGPLNQWSKAMAAARAYENEVYMTFTHPDQGLIIDRDGRITGECTAESFLIREVELKAIKKPRAALKARRPNTYRRITKSPRR
jgi:predicted amidohydrolase